MKKIRPVERYDADQEYPSTADLEAAGPSERRTFLKGLLASAAAVGTGLWLGSEAQAGSGTRPRSPSTPPPPGVPPQPVKGPRPRLWRRDKPPVPGGMKMPHPNPRPKRPCAPVAAVTLDALFAFCGDRNGQIVVSTAAVQVAKLLHKPGEGRRLASVVKPVFAQEKSCGWIDRPQQKAQVEARLAKALTEAYQQAVGGTLAPLKVKLIVSENRQRLKGVAPMPKPRPAPTRGCASCSTSASIEDVLLPAGLVTLALLATKDRSK